MEHRSHDTDDELVVGSDRSFGIVFAVVFCVIGLWPLLFGRPLRDWAMYVAAAFVVTAMVRPAVLAPLNRAWMRFGAVLHKVMNPVLLGLIYLLCIVPTGLIMKLLGRDAMRLRREPGASTYWIGRTPAGPEPDSLRNMF
jgi:hypothetical protein